jgi:hypothetical protein
MPSNDCEVSTTSRRPFRLMAAAFSLATVAAVTALQPTTESANAFSASAHVSPDAASRTCSRSSWRGLALETQSSHALSSTSARLRCGTWYNTSMEKQMEKSKLLESLSEGRVTVLFTKKDGTDRTMICTRNIDMIDEEYHPKGTMIESDNNIRAFDLENNGWRSFNFDTVKEVL